MTKVIDSVSTTTNEAPIVKLLGANVRMPESESGYCGMRPISSIEKQVRDQLEAGTYSGYEGYTLSEYGTVATWTSTSSTPTLDTPGKMSSFAYKSSCSYDDQYAFKHGSIWFTNTFTFSSLSRASESLSFRPYAILKKDGSSDITVYDDYIISSPIGRICLMFSNFYSPTDTGYTALWRVIHYCYPNIPCPTGIT